MTFISKSWDAILQDEYEKDYFKKLRIDLTNEYSNYEIYPKEDDIFNCFKEVSYEDIKVVILGQDPYHGLNQAHGFSFSVLPGNKIPPSLLNIYKELNNEFNYDIPNHGYLIKWAKQGVLLMNRTLTVRRGQANSHEKIGWKNLTSRIISEINESPQPIVFMLWGNNAKEVKCLLNNANHLVLESPHPSPFSAHRGFLGNNHFYLANEFLNKNGIEPIDWKIDKL